MIVFKLPQAASGADDEVSWMLLIHRHHNYDISKDFTGLLAIPVDHGASIFIFRNNWQCWIQLPILCSPCQTQRF